MTKNRREFLIGAGVAAATGMIASKVPLAAQTTSYSAPTAPVRPKGGGPFFQHGHDGTIETIAEHAVVVYHKDTGEVLHVHISTTLQGGAIPTQEELEERSLTCALRAAEKHNQLAATTGKQTQLMHRNREFMNVLHAHPDILRQGAFRVDPHRQEIVPIN